MDITNPAVIIFLVENYEKEARIRLNWLNKNWEKVKLAATLQRPATDYHIKDTESHCMKEGITTVIRDHIVAARHKRKAVKRDGKIIGIEQMRRGNSIVDLGIADPKEDPRLVHSDLESDPIMRPVDPKMAEIIYKPKPEYGREVYLKLRSRLMPEKRYYLPECSNMENGWRMRDSAMKMTGPKFGKCWRLTHDLRNRVGPTPDPPHYNPSDAPTITKCT